jgi:hypothetical protein
MSLRAPRPMVIVPCDPLGYRHHGELYISGREAFTADGARCAAGRADRCWPTHHLHVCRGVRAAASPPLSLIC